MTGETLYVMYCESAAHLSEETRRNEALPAWAFVPTEQRRLWERIAKRLIDEWETSAE